MKASICMATHNRPDLLQRTLESIYRQRVPFDFETIVVDDGTVDCAQACLGFPVTWVRIHDPAGRHSSSVCRNIAYRHARGEVIIAQSDEVLHKTPQTIEHLVGELQPGTFVLASVYNVDARGCPVGTRRNPLGAYTSPHHRRPLFFLGALWREDLCAIGGNDEDFVYSVCEDKWFADCLIYGQKLTPIYTDRVIGHHQDHPRTPSREHLRLSQELYRRKVRHGHRTGQWCARGGPWR